MDRCAVFVDAGYLFAQGSAALFGGKRQRSMLVLNGPAVVREIRHIVSGRAPGRELLRIYWYDAAIGSRPKSDQAVLAELDDVKLRLGFLNNAGEQKGVDSLIVTDLIELARLKSISDALLISGDEDVRVGVQIAQNYGVRVHLLGIHPARGSQSSQLMQEADTTSEWMRTNIENFLSLRDVEPFEERSVVASAKTDDEQPVDLKRIAIAVSEFAGRLGAIDLDALQVFWKTRHGVPSDIDRKLMSVCRTALDRDLEPDEKRYMRARFKEEAKGHFS